VAYMLTLTAFLPFFGRLADVFGRTRLYNIGFVVFTIGSLFCGMATSAAYLIAARVAQAIGAGLLQANSVAIIIEAFPISERGKAIGIQGSIQAISMAVGPFIGGLLINSIGWRTVFYINIPIGILGTIAALYILPKSKKTGDTKNIDYFGSLLLATGLAFFVTAFNEGTKAGLGSQTNLVYFLCAFILLGMFVFTELRAEHPLIDLKLFKHKTFFIGNVTGMLSYYMLFAVLFLMPFYLQHVREFSPALTGSLLTPIPIAMAIVAPFAGYLSDRYGSRPLSISGMLVMTVACTALLFSGVRTSLPLLAGELVLLGIGIGLFTPCNNSAIMSAAPSDRLGLAGGYLNMMRSLGAIFGVNISGVIFTLRVNTSLAGQGFTDVRNVFGDDAIPLMLKHEAFMDGFAAAIAVLVGLGLIGVVLAILKKDSGSCEI
jgi:EmrB/QacA subfamily drug resistance transporter